jgi:hypothetical protein
LVTLKKHSPLLCQLQGSQNAGTRGVVGRGLPTLRGRRAALLWRRRRHNPDTATMCQKEPHEKTKHDGPLRDL